MKRFLHVFGLLSLVFLLSACTTQVTQTTTPTPNATPMNGRVVMSITDAAADMGAVTNVLVTVDAIALHSEAKGWVTVATPQKTYDLLALKASGENALLADLSLAPARYDQMRLDVSKVMITDASGTHEAKLPSTVLRLNGEIVVLESKTATASFDFIADKSLHVTGNGKYVFAPVIQLDTRTNANAQVVGTVVTITGGTEQTSSRVGMDVSGNLVVGATLPPYLSISSNGTVSGTQSIALPPLPDPNADIDLNSRVN